MLDQVEEAGLVDSEPAEMIRNVLELGDLRARDVMVPRAKVEAIEASTPLDVLRRLVAASGHSRYPVYRGQLDEIVGLLVAKDLFAADATHDPNRATTVADLMRPAVRFVHESQSLSTILRD